MHKQDTLLEQALFEIAAQETRTLEQCMTFADMQAAKRMQNEHKKDALALIRKHIKTFSAAPYLRVAAVLVVLLGGLFLLRSLPTEKNILPPEVQHLQPLFTHFPAEASPTVNSGLPTSTPIFGSDELPSPTPTPQNTVFVPVNTTHAPVLTPTPTLIPTATPTLAPTLTLIPTAPPTAAPTSESAYYPDDWQGDYFPQAHNGQWAMKKGSNDDSNVAVYDDSYEFAEYANQVILPVTDAEDCRFRYVSVNGVPALLTEDKAGRLTLTWDVEGRTLSLFTPIGDEETLLSLAETVCPIAY